MRVRPLNQKEAAEDATNVVQKLSVDSLSLGDQQFTFDSVAGETESQVSRSPLSVEPVRLVESIRVKSHLQITSSSATGVLMPLMSFLV